MSETSKTDWERLAKLDDSDIDTSDIPPLGEDFFRRAVLMNMHNPPPSRGVHYRDLSGAERHQRSWAGGKARCSPLDTEPCLEGH